LRKVRTAWDGIGQVDTVRARPAARHVERFTLRNPRNIRTVLRHGATVAIAGALAVGVAAEAPADAQSQSRANQAIARKMVHRHHWSNAQFNCLVKLWNRESGWRTRASNPSGAYGIPQALPGSKMRSAGRAWRTSATVQIKWGLGYIKGRYGTPCGAWAHSQRTGWY
jgi:hypothetical protein